MSPKSSSKSFLFKVLKLFLLLFSTGCVFLAIYFLNDFFSIKNIKIINYKKTILGLSDLKNKNLIFETQDIVEKKILSENPSIKSVSIKKLYPSTLILNIKINSPLAVLEVNNGYFYLDNDGKIISKSRNLDHKLPIINFYEKLNFTNYTPGEVITFKDVQYSLFFLQTLNNLDIKVDNLDINGINMLVFNLKERKIIFSSEKDKRLQVYEFEQIFKEFKIQGKQFKEIDLRFDKPIVRF